MPGQLYLKEADAKARHGLRRRAVADVDDIRQNVGRRNCHWPGL